MKLNLSHALAVAGVVALAGAATAAQARDNVYWSVGIDAAPGISLGVGNARPVYVAPAPVYVAPAPVYIAPRPVVIAPQPVYYAAAPAPVYYEPVYVHPGKRKGWHKKHHRHGW
ncbi:MAG TPA: hypothetical protein VF522_06785 [Ramlibacter sp.]|uniref:hypothetical protein n=1 Tax=Ramlibacter sp. TaxID=1917967 RepID=UPI002ED4A6EC